MNVLTLAAPVLHTWHGALLQGVPGAATPSPGPSTIEVPSEEQTSPGLIGFLVTFAVALAVIGLAVALVRALRRVDRRAQLAEQEDEAERVEDHAPGGEGR